MIPVAIAEELSYQARLDALRAKKLEQTQEKQQVIGAMDHDDWALILPPPENRKIVQAVSGSGVTITDCLIDGLEMVSNHANGGFYGPAACGANFRRLLDAHPTYIDPMCSLAGAVMANFTSYRRHGWKPELSYDHLKPEHEKYQIIPGIGGGQHFCPDLAIGFELGWGGILDQIADYRPLHTPAAGEFYDGLEQVVLGIQHWIRRHADAACALAHDEPHPQLRQNLIEIAQINQRLITDPPRTFREACQWMVWYLMAARMYNGSGALGRLDVLLTPFYAHDVAAGTLTDDEAVFHIACLLLRDTAYAQLGGPDADGHDVTNHVSYLVLEAIDRLKVPANIGVCVGAEADPGLLRRGVEIQFAHKMGFPKFLGIDQTVAGLVANGFPVEDARARAYSGCHWSAIPGREYTMNDMVKLNFATLFDVALREMLADPAVTPSMDDLWRRFEHHLQRAIQVLVDGFELHLANMHQVFPELVLDLLCYGPIEKGQDATYFKDGRGCLDYYNLGIDGAALATAADSFAAVEQRVAHEGRISWTELLALLDANWAGPDGQRTRLMLQHIPRYGAGGSRADAWAVRIVEAFTRVVQAQPTPGFMLTPGLFSWASTLAMGRKLGATPDGRYAGDPISHGCNPNPGFREDGATTAMAVAIAGVQPGLGNAGPMQLELDPGLARGRDGIANVESLIRTHFDLGGTQINLNVLDKMQVLEAHKDPSKYPDLIVRVTGFSAYFASLSPEFRQLVVDRIIAEG
jgi:formate C-acetyltransferase